MLLGTKLIMYRRKEGLKREEAADLIGISTISLTRYENNIEVPSMNIIIRFAELYNISVFDIIGVYDSISGQFDQDETAALQRSDDEQIEKSI